MLFKEYVDGLVDLLARRPDAADFEVVTSTDDEGNGFNRVYFPPGIGNYDGEDWIGEEECIDDPDQEQTTPNAVVVN